MRTTRGWCGNLRPRPALILASGIALLLAGFASWATAAADFGKDLVGWWLLDEGGGIVAGDSSGAGHDGSLSGAVGFTTDALLGTALDFTGEDGTVTVPHDPALQPPTGTIEAWVKVESLQDSDIVAVVTDCRLRTDPTCSTPVGISVIGMRIQADGGAHAFVADDHDPVAPWTFASAPPGLITAHAWHHLAMRWDGVTVAIFVDGILRDATPYDPIPGPGLSYHGGFPTWLGVATTWATPPPHDLIGQLDDVRFYARPRNEVEIFTDYITRGNKPAKPPGT